MSINQLMKNDEGGSTVHHLGLAVRAGKRYHFLGSPKVVSCALMLQLFKKSCSY
jgi:hypothetical protein